jgi:hypothetical protein
MDMNPLAVMKMNTAIYCLENAMPSIMRIELCMELARK